MGSALKVTLSRVTFWAKTSPCSRRLRVSWSSALTRAGFGSETPAPKTVTQRNSLLACVLAAVALKPCSADEPKYHDKDPRWPGNAGHKWHGFIPKVT